ncbi:HAMP domain-containing sensor histidine kinase [Virgisporangium ochraceum]
MRLRPWQRPWLRPWREWTVRSRIVVSVALLAAVALIAVDVAGIVLLRSYSVQRIDELLERPSRPGPRSVAENNRPPNYVPDFRVYRYDSTGTLLGPVPETLEPDPGDLPELARRAASGRPYYVDGASGTWRVRVDRTFDGGYIVNALSLTELQRTQDRLVVINLVVAMLALVFLALASATVVRVGLRPLTRMEETAARIAGGDLSQRVADADPHTESGRLGLALNTMLTRIEEAAGARADSERRLRQFLADAAHELRTPLTSIQGFAELYRRGGAPPGPALDEAMGTIENEVGRMRLLVDDLFTLARLDEERPIADGRVDLLAVAAEAVRDAHVRVPDRFVRLAALDDRQDTFEPVTVPGDEARIRQVVANLVGNALQHTGDDVRVVVRVGRPMAPGGERPPTTAIGDALPDGTPLAAVEVCDAGPGMAAADAERVFERLYRADPSRSRQHGGAGLGLAIVAAIVQAHHGRIELWTAPGAGARFRVLFRAFSEEA